MLSQQTSNGVDTAKGKPRLMLMGQRRSGKSSIANVVFNKMPPAETLFLESTARITKESMHVSSFMDFQVWDFPGQLDFLDPSFDSTSIFGNLGSLIWVIDAQDDYLDALTRLCALIIHVTVEHPTINIEVFIHKTDGLSDDYKFDLQRDIMQRVQDECSDMGLENINVGWYNTSIYNHSIFEAFSRVIQKLIPWLGWAEGLLNEVARACRFEKVYLFDVLSKIYIATDSSPVDMGCYEICSDFIDVVVDISSIYGWERPKDYIESLEGPPWNRTLNEQMGCTEAEATVVLKDGRRPIVLREVDRYLALVGVLREGGAERLPMVRANVETVVRGLEKVFEVTRGKK